MSSWFEVTWWKIMIYHKKRECEQNPSFQISFEFLSEHTEYKGNTRKYITSWNSKKKFAALGFQ